MSTSELTSAELSGPRPNVLAYPSPTTSRFIVFVAALLAAGAFVGGWVHTQVLGVDYVKTVARCEQRAERVQLSATDVSSALKRNAAAERCRAGAERRRAAFAFAGALVSGAAGLVVLFVVPAVLERRRRLRVLPPTLEDAAQRASQLTGEVGLTRRPTLMLGPTTLHDAFSYGRPGHYRIALPPAVAVRWRDPALFDPLMHHELAHIEHGDVALAWLARSVWYALAPLLALPVFVAVARDDLSLMPDYVWRAALLAISVELIAAGLLRSREHDADLRAGQVAGGPGAVSALVDRTHGVGSRSRWRRPLAKHPSTADRLAVLDQPQIAARVTFIDGLTTGFLSALSIPVIVSVLIAFLTGSGHLDDALLIASGVAGPLLAGSIGLGLCRAAVVNRVGGQPASPVAPALGVAFGLAAGETASLAQTGIGAASLHPLAWLPLLALLGAGATVLAASIAELLADAAPAARGVRSSWLLALIIMAVLYSAVLWIGTVLETPLEFGWAGVEAWLVTALQSPLVLSALGALGAAVVWWAWASGRAYGAPSWILERGGSLPWHAATRRDLLVPLSVGLLAGTAAAGTLTFYRLAAGAAPNDLVRSERFYLFVWMGAAAGFAAAISVARSRALRGAAIGAGAGIVACLTTITGWLALNTALGGYLSWGFVTAIAKQPLALTFPAVVIAAPAMLARPRKRPSALLAWMTTAALALVCGGVLIAKRASLPPFGAAANAALKTPAALQASSAAIDAQLYTTTVMPRIAAGYRAFARAAGAINAQTTIDGSTRSRLIRSQVLPPLRSLLSVAAAFRTSNASVRATNATCLVAIRSSLRGFELLAVASASHDATALASADATLRQAQTYWSRWLQQALALLRAG